MRIASTAIALSFYVLASSPGTPAEKTLVAWEFEGPGQLEGWQPNSHLRDTVVADGVLHTRGTDWDPFLVSGLFDAPARPWQFIEIRIKADRPGKGEFFWSNSLETGEGGFQAGKETKFTVRRAGQWETLKVYPFWHTEERIIHLRLDLYDGAAFEVDYIRVVDPGVQPVDKSSWGFDANAEGWHAFDEGCRLEAREGMVAVTMADPSSHIVAPPISVAVGDRFWVSIRMRVPDTAAPVKRCHGRVWCASESRFGKGHADFVVKADGRSRVYNVDMTRCRHWDSRLLLLGLTPVMTEGATAEIDEITVTAEPLGPPLIEVGHLGLADAINPAGRPAQVTATIRNAGGDTAEGIRARLHLPPDVRLDGSPVIQELHPLELMCSEEVTWPVVSELPRKATVGFTLEGPGAPPGRLTNEVEFTRPLGLPKASYVPEPEPVPSRYDVGVFYFPGWCSASHWEPIRRVAPMRKPVLGWYDEANPECADWQIKWAVEHGVRFFVVDWYWHQGGRQLEHWLHNAYLKARHRKYLKFCLMWANHNSPGSHSPEDWRAVTQYWIDKYFHLDEYYRIEDRPAVYIWAPYNIRRDVGGTAEATKLYALSQEMAREAGYKGIYFVAMNSHTKASDCEQLRAEGYEAFTSYHGFAPAQKQAGRRVFPFELVVRTSPALWESCLQKTELRYQPVVETGWSAEPWHGGRAMIIHDRTPKLFGQLCREARAFADRTGRKIIAVGPWNEWGEGSYIEPCTEFGFGMLDELRAAFCAPGSYPPNIAPVHVGLGPYDLPMPPTRFRTAWTFDRDAEGWALSMGLSRHSSRAGSLAAKSTSRDPAFTSPALRIRANKWPRLRVRMKVSGVPKGDRCQVFWETPTAGTSEAASVQLEIVPDTLHDYEFLLGTNTRWRGLITRIRLDPTFAKDALIEIDEVGFEK